LDLRARTSKLLTTGYWLLATSRGPMSRTEVNQRRLVVTFVILLLAQFGLMTATARHDRQTGSESVLRGWAISLVTPIQWGIGSVFSGVASIWYGYVDLRGVRQHNGELETENGQLRSEVEAARAAASENEQLRRMLDLKPLMK